VNTTVAEITRSRSSTWIAVFLGGAAVLAAWFIIRSALPYFQVSPDHYGPYFWPRRWWLVLHIAGGVIALSVGIVQLWLGLTNRVARLHRALGKLYVGVIVLGSIGGFYLALTIYPVVRTLYNSVLQILPRGRTRFVGFDNYVALAFDPTFWTSVVHTLIWSVVSPIADVALGLLLALCLYAGVPLQRFFRIAWFTPVLISYVVVAIMWT